MTSSVDKPVDVRRYLRGIWRGKGIVVLCAVSALCATLVLLALGPKQYQSRVTLIVQESQRLSTELAEVMGGIMQSPVGSGLDEERMAQLVGRIQSPLFLERVARVLKMNEDPIVRAEAEGRRGRHPDVSVDEVATRIAVGRLRSKIRVGSSGKGIYRISVADDSAEKAQILAKWISKLFVDTSSQSTLDRLRTAREFGTEQLRVYQQRLRQSEQELERYKQSMISRSLTRGLVQEENLGRAQALCQRLVEEESTARIRVRTCSAAVAALGIGTDSQWLLDDPMTLELVTGLAAALKGEVAERLAGDGREVRAWSPSGSYRALQGDLLCHVEMVAAQLHPEGGGDAVSAVARFLFARIDLGAQSEAAGMLSGAIADFKQQAESQPGGEFELDRLEENVAANRSLLQSFRAQLVASDVSQAVEVTKLGVQFKILDPASLPLTQSSPNRRKLLLASLLLGPLLGIGLVFLRESQDVTLRSVEDFTRAVPEPILGTTPRLGRLANRRSWVRRYWIPATLGGVVLLTAVFFMARTSILRDFVTAGQPVHLVNPEEPRNNGP